jgi:hypothetical protein
LAVNVTARDPTCVFVRPLRTELRFTEAVTLVAGAVVLVVAT